MADDMVTERWEEDHKAVPKKTSKKKISKSENLISD